MRACAVLALATLAACGSAVPLDGDGGEPADNDLAFCISETNRYRAEVSAAPLAASFPLEVYAEAGARQDGTAHTPHQHFLDTQGGGVASAENEIPWWSLSQYGSVREVIRRGLAMMWAEGPGGGHYENMTGPSTQLGCGIFVNGDEVTVVQDQGPGRNNLRSPAADPSRLAASLVGYIPKGMRPPRSLPGGRLGGRLRATYSAPGPYR